MKKQNHTIKALISSLLTLALCFTMLVGTTFAWFTDSVSSNTNKIVAGNLDVELEYSKVVNGVRTDWALVEGEDEIFDPNALWEPGRIEVVYLKVSNLGTLALKYKLGVRFSNEVSATNAAGETFLLSNHLVFKVVEMDDALATYDTYEDAVNAAGTEKGIKNYASETKNLDAKDGANDEDYVALIVYMPQEVGNEANYRGTAPSINLGIMLSATQYTSESDSYGDQYDADAPCTIPASNIEEFLAAIENGDNVLLETPIVINADFVKTIKERSATTYNLTRNTTTIDNDAVIDGNGSTVYRTEEMLNQPLFTVESGYTLTLSNITLDGGAEWTGEIDPVLLRGTVNSGLTTTANIVSVAAGAHLVLNEGAVVQNNDGQNAISVSAATSTLVLNGGEVINNASGAGAIWGGGDITVNEGSKLNGNASTYYGGVVRMVSGAKKFTMNGGEMNHNYTTSSGGALGGGGLPWGSSSTTAGNGNHFILNGGEIAYNYCEEAGGAIYTNSGAIVQISGDFTMHDNGAGDSLGSAIRFAKYSAFTMTGGNIYNNGTDAFWSYWTTVKVSGGTLDNDGTFTIAANSEPTVGGGDIEDAYYFDLGIVRNRVNLVENFGTVYFKVNENVSHFANFHFAPAEGYTYAEGDEAKLICLNEGYSTYWDADAQVFKIQKSN